MTQLHSHPRDFGREELLDRLRDFHGHLGPFAMLGYRAGRLAVRDLGIPTHFGLAATVHCPPQPPPSCFVDGVQYATGCTLGKRNIELIPDDAVFVVVTGNDSGATLTVVPRREVVAQFAVWIEEADPETAALRVLDMSDDELFEPRE
ncbi:MAG: FmdE family protein [Armatimonadota bacterium]|jgi:formylmethanofuran dehydrogenase subunit E